MMNSIGKPRRAPDSNISKINIHVLETFSICFTWRLSLWKNFLRCLFNLEIVNINTESFVNIAMCFDNALLDLLAKFRPC